MKRRARRRSIPTAGLLIAIVTVLLIIPLLVLSADVAQASLFLIFDRTSGDPGTVVHVRTAGNGACALCPQPMPLYFAWAAVSGSISSPDDPGLVRVGNLTVDEHGNGSGFFKVPEVRNGRYVVMTYCEPCAPYSAGRVILPLGPFPPFRVVGSTIAHSTPGWPWIVAGFLGLAFVTAAFIRLLARSRRRNRVRPSEDADDG
jgi:hypothetical protein